ncbi:hypothetical protein V0288_05285 [Pannus brasiliensis CCIBt3594]|uniref:MotA/TolQ/ExbB proton channel domain-containing protein n=2 Tax=Pannus TaxID=1427526 RepID=A0AAW9QMY4_9CHRO
MMAWLTLVPPYLFALTVLLVILPTVIAISIRIALYRYLRACARIVKRPIDRDSPSKYPKIIETLESLETKFKQVIPKVDRVNTSALVDELYNKEEFPFLRFSLRCVKWDYFGNILPNLLLAFGLLGTFLGITLNLTEIGSLVQRESLDSGNLIENLKVPLQSMGIAFFTSLIALISSSILTVLNFFFDTNIARLDWITSLENYLDNTLQPEIIEISPLDRMVKEQGEFLESFRTVIEQVIADNSAIFFNSVTSFSESTKSFEERIDRLEIIIQHENFIEYGATLERCVSDFQKTIDTLERSKVTTNLVTATQNLNSTQEQLSNTIQALQDCSNLIQQAMTTLASSSLSLEEQIREVSQDFYQLQTSHYQLNSEIGEKTLDRLQDLSDKLEANNGIFTEKIDRSNLSIERIHNTLLETSRHLNNHSDHLQSLGDRIALAIDREGQLGNERNRILADKIGQTSDYLRGMQASLNQMIVLLDRPNDRPDRPNDSPPRWRPW